MLQAGRSWCARGTEIIFIQGGLWLRITVSWWVEIQGRHWIRKMNGLQNFLIGSIRVIAISLWVLYGTTHVLAREKANRHRQIVVWHWTQHGRIALYAQSTARSPAESSTFENSGMIAASMFGKRGFTTVRLSATLNKRPSVIQLIQTCFAYFYKATVRPSARMNSAMSRQWAGVRATDYSLKMCEDKWTNSTHKALLQTSHTCGRSPVWMRLWTVSAERCIKDLPHPLYLQTLRMMSVRGEIFRTIPFSHNGRSFAWIRAWLKSCWC